jgi:hypothetical protein
MERLTEELWKRRRDVRDLIEAFRTSVREPFPNWEKNGRRQ